MEVVKIGGSLLLHAPDILDILKDYGVLLVPGGGIFADNVRKFSETLNLSHETAHTMAILATHQYGHLLSEISGIPTTTSLGNNKGPAILLPLNLVRKSGLEASWDVTSDTIACYVARLLGKKCFVKLTDVDGIMMGGRVVKNIEAGKLLNTTTCVDKSLPSYLQTWNMRCRVTNGMVENNIRKALEGVPIGTLITGGT